MKVLVIREQEPSDPDDLIVVKMLTGETDKETMIRWLKPQVKDDGDDQDAFMETLIHDVWTWVEKIVVE